MVKNGGKYQLDIPTHGIQTERCPPGLASGWQAARWNLPNFFGSALD
jgi:hypothetical protein